MTPHRLNCRLCTKSTIGDSSCPLKHYVKEEDLSLTMFLEGAMRIVGCASHPLNIIEQDDPCIECIHIKKEIRDAREKVLDELTKLREKGEYCLGIFHKLEEYERLWREEWDWIKSLRTTKGDVKTP